MKDLIIVGASGFGREVAWLVERINTIIPTWNLLGFIDDNKAIQGSSINGRVVLGAIEDAKEFKNAFFVCAIGSSKIRESLINRIGNVRFATLIDPSVVMSNCIEIGEGSIICSNTVITTNVTIGKHSIINLCCTIGHDAVLDDFVTLYPSVNVSGNTHYGKCVEIGTGSQVIQGKNIGSGTIVGAGSVVVKDLPEECTAVGIPAKPIKYHEV